MAEEIKLLFEEADDLCWGNKPDESDDKWMQAASKFLEEEAAVRIMSFSPRVQSTKSVVHRWMFNNS
ncbi:hypothetical protein CASFOL_016668 [Castilleja foliolosa]|uniref:Uncharacterized protein n=1 Tax=Castilleja foliolosa TaxID=1961234 RepID=A0ABD3DAY9_9LAMI